MRCNCCRSSAARIAQTAVKSIISSKHLAPCRRTSCMSNWAQDWSTALEEHASDAGHGHSLNQKLHSAATHTPHPAPSSSREAAEWEAVLTATEAAAAASNSAEASAALQDGNETFKSIKGSPTYAVVECGSHCTRLLLSTAVADVARLTIDTQLGAAQQQEQPQKAAAPSQLGRTAMSATLQALLDYSKLLQQHNVVSKAAVATAAVRHAADAQQFVQAASTILGCQLQVLSGPEEGQLAFIGATSSLAHTGRCCLVFDLGGNSTEISVGIAGQAPTAMASIPLGCLSIQAGVSVPAAAAAAAPEESGAAANCKAQDHHHQQQQQQLDLQQPDNHHRQQRQQQLQLSAEAVFAAHRTKLQAVFHTYKQQQQQSRAAPDIPRVAVIGTGGTITTIAALQQELPEYSHQAVHMSTVRQQDVVKLVEQLEAVDSRERFLRNFPWLTGKRYGSLLPGCCGVLALMRQLDVQHVLVSDCDLLDGMLLKLQQTQGQ